MMAPGCTPIAFTIAGSDPSGGAGLQADLKTFAALGVYGCAAVTALTAQNTLGVSAVWPVPAGSVAGQIASVLEDVPVCAIKLGMLFSREVIEEVATELAKYPQLPVVCDPVMVATSGDHLLNDDAVQAMIERFVPNAALLTPNTAEAAVLLNCEAAGTENALCEQAGRLLDLGAQAVLLKGGHIVGQHASDVLVWREAGRRQLEILRSPRIPTNNTHGTGCTLAAAIAAGLAKGEALIDAVGHAKRFVSGAIAHADELHIGAGAGPINHGWRCKN
ncbi:MAG: bifunctional hydroxymethylpyrimidine kinase/phosphomethylpyrimidine kinase [Cellvibrionaceae bacterium]